LVPSALKKAESLALHAKQSGSPLSEFAVTVTLGEAYELLDYLLEQNPHPLLKQDVEEAKVRGNPYVVLENFQILGLAIVPVSALH
jgi:hypothetical protein